MQRFSLSKSPEFIKSFRKLDRSVARRILAALIALTQLDDPTAKLKPLRRTKVGLWRLCVGDYRVILDVHREELVIIALDAGHRSTVYDD